MSETKFIAMGMVWDVMDWTAAVIVVCVIFVLTCLILAFFCVFSGDKDMDEQLALERTQLERAKLNHNFKQRGSERVD